jgi:dethiobiotin synthetase
MKHATTRAGAWKPIATGLTDAMGDDARAIGATEPPLYRFEPPISPHLAARRVGVTIEARAIAERAGALARGFDLFFVESAGGLFSPISETETNLDVARELETTGPGRERTTLEATPGFRLLLVAPDRIGVLHDVTATVRAAGVHPVIALSAPAVADASTGTNAEEIRRLGLAADVVEFPRAAPAEAECADAARRCLEALRKVR